MHGLAGLTCVVRVASSNCFSCCLTPASTSAHRAFKAVCSKSPTDQARFSFHPRTMPCLLNSHPIVVSGGTECVLEQHPGNLSCFERLGVVGHLTGERQQVAGQVLCLKLFQLLLSLAADIPVRVLSPLQHVCQIHSGCRRHSG